MTGHESQNEMEIWATAGNSLGLRQVVWRMRDLMEVEESNRLVHRLFRPRNVLVPHPVVVLAVKIHLLQQLIDQILPLQQERMLGWCDRFLMYLLEEECGAGP